MMKMKQKCTKKGNSKKRKENETKNDEKINRNLISKSIECKQMCFGGRH